MSAGAEVTEQAASTGRRLPRIVDADVHNAVSDVHDVRGSREVLTKYMSRRWARHVELVGVRYPQSGGYIPRPRPFVARHDSWPPDGGVPGGDVAFLREQLLDAYPIDAAILNPIDMTTLGGQFGELSAALTSAMNDWTAAEWLAEDDRLWGSICVPFEVPELAVAEIERLGDHPRFVQILLNHRTRDPLGSRRYWPMYEAAVAHELPVAMHVGGHGSDTISGAGWPTYGFEDHAGLPQAFQTHVTSFIANGVFERFPTLRIVLQEGGFAWLASLMWRLDMAWELLAEEVPQVTRRPSETIREHIYFTTQPIEEPERPEYFTQLMEDLAMDDRALFASDYPHWDFDAPDQTLPRGIGEELKGKILAGNALALYPKLVGR